MPEAQTIRTIRDLKVYQFAYRLAMDMFEVSAMLYALMENWQNFASSSDL